MRRAKTEESNWPARSVEIWPLAKIKKYARNPKKHTDEQVRQLAAMMKEFGVTTAILLDEKREIIAGHGRLEAAELNGYAGYPVMQAKGWSEAQKIAYRLADNVIPNAAGAAMLPAIVDADLTTLGELNYDTDRFGLDEIKLPDLVEMPEVETAPRAPRKRTTIFLSILNADVEKARKVVAQALSKAKIDHNL